MTTRRNAGQQGYAGNSMQRNRQNTGSPRFTQSNEYEEDDYENNYDMRNDYENDYENDDHDQQDNRRNYELGNFSSRNDNYAGNDYDDDDRYDQQGNYQGDYGQQGQEYSSRSGKKAFGSGYTGESDQQDHYNYNNNSDRRNYPERIWGNNNGTNSNYRDRGSSMDMQRQRWSNDGGNNSPGNMNDRGMYNTGRSGNYQGDSNQRNRIYNNDSWYGSNQGGNNGGSRTGSNTSSQRGFTSMDNDGRRGMTSKGENTSQSGTQNNGRNRNNSSRNGR